MCSGSGISLADVLAHKHNLAVFCEDHPDGVSHPFIYNLCANCIEVAMCNGTLNPYSPLGCSDYYKVCEPSDVIEILSLCYELRLFLSPHELELLRELWAYWVQYIDDHPCDLYRESNNCPYLCLELGFFGF